jgi:hypothetical protein
MKRILLVIIGFVIIYFVSTVLFTVLTGYKVKFGNYQKYEWVFKDAYKNQIDRDCSLKCVNFKNVLNLTIL